MVESDMHRLLLRALLHYQPPRFIADLWNRLNLRVAITLFKSLSKWTLFSHISNSIFERRHASLAMILHSLVILREHHLNWSQLSIVLHGHSIHSSVIMHLYAIVGLPLFSVIMLVFTLYHLVFLIGSIRFTH